MIEIHDWTGWRRPQRGRLGYYDPATVLPDGSLPIQPQSRRCKRCGKTQSRPFPSSRKQPPGVE